MPPTPEHGKHSGDGDRAARQVLHWIPEPDGPKQVRFDVSADWVSPSLVRARIRRWLGGLRWPSRRIDEMVLAVSEVVSNSIEHGYRMTEDVELPAGVVELDCAIAVDASGFSRAVVTVSDRGHWREQRPTTRMNGRGMMLARACTDRMQVRHRRDGTTVTLCSRPIPPPPDQAP